MDTGGGLDEMLIDYFEKIVAIAGYRMEFTKEEGDRRTIMELVRRIRKNI